ncbi:MAG: response regulator transcription factor [Lachnospirales bacterium]
MSGVIYIAEDDVNLCSILKSQLVSDGYEVEDFYDGKALLERFNEKQCDLIITDIMMPIMSGYDLCKEVRKLSDIPVIMLSAKDEEIDKLIGLELGGDDYISKPYSLREVSVKVRNMLRRSNKSKIEDEEKIEGCFVCNDLIVHVSSRTVTINNEEFQVTTREYELLELLVKNKNMAFSREKIIENIWGYDYYGDSRQVDHLIKRLRKKLLLAEAEFTIETIWGYGYKVSD